MQVPFFFKWAIDGLSLDPSGGVPVAGALIALTPPAMLIMYGVARATSAFCNELRNAVFAKVMLSLTLPTVTGQDSDVNGQGGSQNGCALFVWCNECVVSLNC